MQIKIVASKTYKKQSYWSFAITPALSIHCIYSYIEKELLFSAFWLMWVIEIEIKINNKNHEN